MKKQVTICFRTSEELRSALAKIAHEEGRTLSSLIELILTDYAKRNGLFLSTEEKPHLVRKAIDRPAEQTGPAVWLAGQGLAPLAKRYPVEDILVAFDLALKNARNLGDVLGDLIDSGAVAEERETLET